MLLNVSNMTIVLYYTVLYHNHSYSMSIIYSDLMLLVGRQEGPVKNEWWGAGVVICLGRGTGLHMAHCHSLSLASVKSRLVFTFQVMANPCSPGQTAIRQVLLLLLQ